MKNRNSLLPLAIAAALTGCSTTNGHLIGDITKKTDDTIAGQPDGTIHQYSKRISSPYLGKRIADAPPPRNIPAVLSGKVTADRLGFDRALSVAEFAARIAQIAHVPVIVDEDVNSKKDGASESLVVNYGSSRDQITLDRIMDMTLWPAHLSWEWNENRVIIRRNIVRTWEVRATADINLDDGSGLSAGISGGSFNGGGANKSASIKDSWEKDTWDKLNEDIARILGEKADYNLNRQTGTVTVRASREKIDAVDRYLKDMNPRLSRSVTVRFDIYRVKVSESIGAGLDFQAIITNKVRWIAQGGKSVVPDGAGVLQASQLLSPSTTLPTSSAPGRVGDGVNRFQGSNIVLQALESVGHTVQTVGEVRRPRNLTRAQIRTDGNKTFVCQTSPATSTNGVTTPGSAQQCLLSTGYKFNFVPSVYGDGTVGLSYKLEMSTADPLTKFDTGGTTVQNASWSTLSDRSDVVVKIGEPMVIATLKTVSLDSNHAIGLTSGSFGVGEDNERTIIVMTAYTER
ncbi:hypothetical protein [Chromobacterium vaccinii]|uniref:hypothetical protein n=1 Tax=Chromobacterium vaccinii TaxID=1108595 RepID=UPI003457FEBA